MPVRVQRVDQPPNRCGFTLRADDPEGYFLGEVLSGWDQKAAVSVSYARSLARELGYVHPDDHQSVADRLVATQTLVDQLENEISTLTARFDAIDLLASSGFVARKKPGRPANQVKEVAA